MRGGVRGVRFNFVKHLGGAPDMAVFNRVIDRIKGRGWHVVLHVDAPDIIPLSDMIRKLPLPFVIDHMGRVPSAAGVVQLPLRALIELSRRDNCWIKVCGSERISMPPYAAAVPIAHALVEAAPDRVLWGTDFPHPNATPRSRRGRSGRSGAAIRAGGAGAKAPAGGQSGPAIWFRPIRKSADTTPLED